MTFPEDEERDNDTPRAHVEHPLVTQMRENWKRDKDEYFKSLLKQ